MDNKTHLNNKNILQGDSIWWFNCACGDAWVSDFFGRNILSLIFSRSLWPRFDLWLKSAIFHWPMGKTEKAEKPAYLKYIMLMNVPYHLDSSSDKNVKSCQDLLQRNQTVTRQIISNAELWTVRLTHILKKKFFFFFEKLNRFLECFKKCCKYLNI